MKRLALTLSICALGCAADSSTDISKEEARSRTAKGDAPYDICEQNGWYGDGICDDFCLYPDTEDCGGDLECYSDADCGAGDSCNADDICLSSCPPGEVCPAVCRGFCVADEEPNECFGAWVDEFGGCRGPADGVLPDECCFPAQVCGGFSNLPCDDDQWCDFEDAPEGAASSLTGLCKPRPEVCYELYAPVCGLDGQTYSNDCFAHMAGTDVDHEGECATEPEMCGGLLGLQCDDDQWCDMSGVPENSADFPGVCEPRPEFCPELYAPVCGYDGNTYSNACHAHAAGFGVTHDGPC